ncbi:hydrophobic surface binding protein A-domain-containing protein [Xylariales sp. PMI_506]|nr:hydrophobic surface binding protein A-domain-containing protein [Xylariales sp. PMI_506]
MQFFNFIFIALFATLSSAVPYKRTATAIENDLTTLNNQLHTLDTDIKAFNGNFLQALILIGAVTTLENDFNTLSTDVTNTGALSAGDSAVIAGKVNTVVSSLATALTDAIAKAPVVASAGYTSDVHDGLVSAKAHADAFFAALEATIDSSQLSAITSAQSTADADFTAAIAAY